MIMKTIIFLKIILLIVITQFSFSSCTNDTVEIITEKQAKIEEQTKGFLRKVDLDATLEISSKEDFLTLLDSRDGGLKSAIVKPDGFVSMNELVYNVDKTILDRIEGVNELGPREKLTFYDILRYDEIVPNENVAEFLNTKGEITVGGTLYRVTELGTFFSIPSLQNEVDAHFNKLVLQENVELIGFPLDNQTIQIAKGIYFIDTFKNLVLEETDSTTFYYAKLDDYEVTTVTSSITPPLSDFGIPGIENYPRFKSGAKTVAGKIWSSLFGDNSFKKVKLSSKRKLKGKLYDYNYGFYSEIGAVAKMRKKNWIGWSGTNADELVLGWRNIILELDPKIPDLPQHSQPVFAGTSYQDIPGFDKKGYCFTIFGLDVNNKQFLTALKAGKSPLVNWLKSNISNGAQIGNNEPSAIFLVSPKKVYLIIVNEDIRAYGKESLRKVFSSNVQFSFSVNLANLPSSWSSWAKTMKDIGKLPVISLKEGEVVVAGRLDNNWGGMIIYNE